MDWKNVNLKDMYERGQNIIDPLNFDTLLLEIECNKKEINRFTIMEQFEDDLKARNLSAREIMAANMDNLIADAMEYRNKDNK